MAHRRRAWPVALLAPIAFDLRHEALTVYGARQGYGTLHGDVARVVVALFLGGGLVGECVVFAVKAGKRR